MYMQGKRDPVFQGGGRGAVHIMHENESSPGSDVAYWAGETSIRGML